jgi:PAS domain S-box-containing protein
LLADSLRCDPARVMSLAHLVHEKTAGNPFFAIQFIASLAEEGLLTFDHRNACWAWDPKRIRSKGYSDNVADLMSAKVNRLPAATRDALQQLACLGSGVDFDQLNVLTDGRSDEIHDALRAAVRMGLVLPSERAYRFVHDRVQEAAYSSIPEDQRAAAHLRTGRLLAARSAPEQIEENVFEIVSQLNRGAHLIEDDEQRAQVAELNLIAGRRAKAAIAHASALGYFCLGLAMLGEDAWPRRYRLVFDLELNRAHCELLTGEFAIAEGHLAALALRAADLTDLAAVISIQVHLYMPQEMYDRAVDICLAYLRRLGVDWSRHPSKDEVRREYERLQELIGERPIESFVDLPLMVDPASRRLMDIFGALSWPANLFDNRLMDLLVLRITNLSLQHGITDESCIGFLFLSLVLGPRFGEYRMALRFGQLSLDLVEKRGLARFKTRVYCSYGSLVNSWVRHVRHGYAYAQRAIDSSPHTGDVTWMGFASRGKVTYRLSCGDPLQEVEAEAERCSAFTRKIKNTHVHSIIALQLRWIRVLRGLTAGFGTLNDHDFDETRFEHGLNRGTLPRYDLVRYWSCKAQLRFLADEYADALAAVAEAEAMPELHVPNIEYAQFVYFAALVRAASFNTAAAEDRRRHSNAVAAYHRRYVTWAEDCPENFRTGAALIGAEIARLEGRSLDAEQLYEDAIRCAREQGFVHYEAISFEVAARFYAERGLQTICDSYLQHARACYLRWGADGKVRHLDLKYPQLRSVAEQMATERTIGAAAEQLDLATVVKVSQAVSSEIELDRLIETLMRTALEHAGATRGLLIRPSADAFWIEAAAITSATTVEVRRPKKLRADSAELPESVLHYVARTHESVMLPDAREQAPYSTDEYVQHNSSRSILCLPLIKQSRLIAVLYLENALLSHVFTPARIATLRLLASQAAVSLENARLYRELQDADTFLAEAQQLSHTGSWSWNITDDEITWSDEMYRIFEFDRSAELTLNSTLRYTHPDDVEKVRQIADGVIQGGKDFELENRLKMPDGSVKHLRVVARATTGDGGDKRYIGTVMDVTAFKEAEERLRKAQAELADMGRQTEMGELASLIAHEVTQPLSAIVTNAASCLLWLKGEQPNVEKARRAAERLIQNGRRAAELVRSIRAQARKSPVDSVRLDMNRLIAETLELLSPELQRRGIRLETRLLEPAAPVNGDATRLQQVIVNLVTNAMEAMEAVNRSSRVVRITTQRDDSGAVLAAVEDSGAGIDPAVLGRIFEPMFTTKPQGMGLGLSICRSIVESHGGRLWAAPNPAGGSIFQFNLPEAREN